MITNETRAVLIQPGEYRIRDGFFEEMYCDGHWETGGAPAYDTDANAVAELRKFVRTRGIKWFEFIAALDDITSARSALYSFGWDMLDATPTQQCAAFDIVFSDELEKL